MNDSRGVLLNVEAFKDDVRDVGICRSLEIHQGPDSRVEVEAVGEVIETELAFELLPGESVVGV